MKIILRCLCYLIFMFVLMPHTLLAKGEFFNEINNLCPDEVALYHETVSQYAVRMLDTVKRHGCQAIKVYSILTDDGFGLLDMLEDNPEAMSQAIKLFSISEKFNEAIKGNSEAIKILRYIMQDRNYNLTTNLFSLLRRQKSFRILRQNKNALYYYFLASLIASQTGDRSDRIFKELKITFNLKQIDTVTKVYLLLSLSQQYDNSKETLYSTDRLLKLIKKAIISLGDRYVKEMSPEDFLYFIPPSTNTIANAANFSHSEIVKCQNDYLDILVKTYKLLVNRYNAQVAIKIIEHLSPFVLNALLYQHNKEQIISYLEFELQSQHFRELLQLSCEQNQQDRDRILARFFSMYAPQDRHGNPIGGGEKNLAIIAYFFTKYRVVAERLMSSKISLPLYITAMSYIPSIYLKLSKVQRRVFDDLLLNLTPHIGINASFLIKLYNDTGYFRWITEDPSFKKYICPEDQKLGSPAPKYKFILLTPYPGDNDPSIFESAMSGFDGINIERINIDTVNLAALYKKNIEELAKHNFVVLEKFGDFYNKADTAINVVSILAIPLTAGLSSSVLVWQAERKTLFGALKVASRRMMTRSAKSLNRLIFKQGSKAAWREFRELSGLALKRGRKNPFEEKIIKGIEKVDNIQSRLNILKEAFAILYFGMDREKEEENNGDYCKFIMQNSR